MYALGTVWEETSFVLNMFECEKLKALNGQLECEPEACRWGPSWKLSHTFVSLFFLGGRGLHPSMLSGYFWLGIQFSGSYPCRAQGNLECECGASGMCQTCAPFELSSWPKWRLRFGSGEADEILKAGTEIDSTIQFIPRYRSVPVSCFQACGISEWPLCRR